MRKINKNKKNTIFVLPDFALLKLKSSTILSLLDILNEYMPNITCMVIFQIGARGPSKKVFCDGFCMSRPGVNYADKLKYKIDYEKIGNKLAGFSKLQKLEITGNEYMDLEKLIKPLVGSNISILKLSQFQFPCADKMDNVIALVSKFKALKCLDIVKCSDKMDIGKALNLLSISSSLEFLSLENNVSENDQSFECLKGNLLCPNLKTLNLSFNYIGPHSFLRLKELLNNVLSSLLTLSILDTNLNEQSLCEIKKILTKPNSKVVKLSSLYPNPFVDGKVILGSNPLKNTELSYDEQLGNLINHWYSQRDASGIVERSCVPSLQAIVLKDLVVRLDKMSLKRVANTLPEKLKSPLLIKGFNFSPQKALECGNNSSLFSPTHKYKPLK